MPSVGLTYAKSFDDPNRLKAYTDPINLYSTTMTVDTTLAYTSPRAWRPDFPGAAREAP